MAVKQNLRGDYTKIYEIVNSFNKGYNTSVADDILNESYFRDINNFLPSEEGNITKRPGINKIGLYQFFDELSNNLAAHEVTLEVSGSTNDSEVNESTLKTPDYLFRQLFQMAPLVKTRKDDIESLLQSDVTVNFTPNKLANFTIFDDNDLSNNIPNFYKLLDDDEAYLKNKSIDFLVIFIGSYTERYFSVPSLNYKYIIDTKATRIIKVHIEFKTEEDTGTIIDPVEIEKKIIINYEIRQPIRTSRNERLAYRYNGDEIIELAIYADNYYYMNSYDALVKISRNVNASTSLVEDSITETYADSSNIYKPTAIEVKNIGFNILSSNPMEFIDSQGSTNAIRGVFYTYNDQPTQIVPYNKEFKIHILSSGTGENQVPEYRPNNGEIDEAVNPYTKMQGSYNSDKSIFTCKGLNESDSIEMRINKGTGDSADKFLAYFTMGSVIQSDIGKIEDIVKLVLSSRYCRVINSQLVLFGNHGYIFFSDYDNFNYFPNYYYLYVAETENEEVVSINYFRQYYAIFTNKRIKRMTGAFGDDDFGVYPLNDYIGCINPRSIKQVQNYLYFLSYNGLYMLKQGYVGEGTENVEQIDLPIYRSYLTENMLKGVTFQNYYALFSEKESIYYNYTNDAYYKFKNAGITTTGLSTKGEVYPTEYTIPFQYNKLQSILFYGIKEDTDSNTKHFDICVQNFAGDDLEINDNGASFVSSFETCYMSFNSPTNIKKFKEIYLKFYNKYGKFIPLYVTIKVDDKVVVSPKDYVVSYDENTDTYYYNEVIASNKELKGFKPLGEMKLGEDILGERTSMVLKMKVREKGRAIKIIVSDGIEEGNEGYSTVQNNYRFDLSTIGVVYKLKKVKEV